MSWKRMGLGLELHFSLWLKWDISYLCVKIVPVDFLYE